MNDCVFVFVFVCVCECVCVCVCGACEYLWKLDRVCVENQF